MHNIKEKINHCISVISKEKDSGWSKSYDCVDNLIEEYGDDLFAERLLNDIPGNISAGVVADILNIAIWSTSDNGAGIIKTAAKWLGECDSERKVKIALALDVVLVPEFANREKLFSRIRSSFPHISIP